MAVENSREAVLAWYFKNAGTVDKTVKDCKKKQVDQESGTIDCTEGSVAGVKVDRDGILFDGDSSVSRFKYAFAHAPHERYKLPEGRVETAAKRIDADDDGIFTEPEITAAAEKLTDEQIESLSILMSKADDGSGNDESLIRDAQYQFANYLGQAASGRDPRD